MDDCSISRLRRRLGLGLMACGLLGNQWVLAALFSADGELEPASRALILSADVALVISGLWLWTRRTRPAVSGLRRLLVHGAVLAAGLVLALAGAEVLLRTAGKRPWITEPLTIAVEPDGPFFVSHPTLGYAHRPGAYTVTLDGEFSFRTTHGADSLRITRPEGVPAEGVPTDKDAIWIFGCSFTYGWSVSDEETYSWRLAQSWPEHDVVNFGANGYGTVHALIQFREALTRRRAPAWVVVAYASFHDHRNVFSRTRRKAVVPWNRLGPLGQPYARLDDRGDLAFGHAEVGYRAFPFSRASALANFLEDLYNHQERKALRDAEVSALLVREMAALARRNGAAFLLAGIHQDAETTSMLERFRQAGGAVADISVDLDLAEHNNAPYDPHPSAVAHRRYADKLRQAILSDSF